MWSFPDSDPTQKTAAPRHSRDPVTAVNGNQYVRTGHGDVMRCLPDTGSPDDSSAPWFDACERAAPIVRCPKTPEAECEVVRLGADH